MQRIGLMLLVTALVSCGGASNTPTAPGPEDPVVIPVTADRTFKVTSIQPIGNRDVSTPFYATIDGTALLDPQMLPAWVGIVYVEGDGSNRFTHWSTLGYKEPKSETYLKPSEFQQEFRARDYGERGEYCTSYQLCKDYLPGKVINAVFFISKMAMDPIAWDRETGNNLIDWDKVAYRQFIPIGYRFR